ncbi:hypothetical protein EXN66_Car012938 [Channa argus]|uniref:Uncharacterized protein n=1 Tax=Channa argus TaxID=215402 RepID=A0A6G1Q4R6_CHAAH|nr:hypothetical protein EXN66_Car012938 [Channa argus]
MAASMWRMNGLWGRMAGGLVLCTLFLSNEMMCQNISTSAPHHTVSSSAATSTITTDLITNATASTAADRIPASQPPKSTSTTPVLDSERNQHINTAQKNVPSKTTSSTNSSQQSSESKSTPSVFVGILVSGLLVALALIVGYCKCQHRPDTKGVKLAEEAFPAEQENQGNTLESEAPLNPPPETQEKPSVNGESPEAPKTQPPPPTNGHSTAKTADTEL